LAEKSGQTDKISTNASHFIALLGRRKEEGKDLGGRIYLIIKVSAGGR
jgi:hypothetical protein